MTPFDDEWKKKFLTMRQGKEFILYAGLLDLGHTKGLLSIRTQFHQIPDADNGQTAICTAEVTMEGGKVFTGIGDASPKNVAPAMQACLIRMAETRAKARALRDAVNIGVAAFEELGDDSGDEQAQQSTGKPKSSRDGTQKQEAASTPDRDKEAQRAFTQHARNMGWKGTTSEHMADLVGLLLRRAPEHWGAETFLEARRVSDAQFQACVDHANKDIESPALILTETPDTTREAMAR